MTDDTTTMVDDAQENADFGAGFEGKAVEPAKTQEPAETPRAEVVETPEYVQITAKDWAEVRAAAAKTASYDQQLSKAFGTIGNLQKLVNGFQAQTPSGRKVEIPKDAFATMEKDFPELAQQTRAALEAALAGVHGTGTDAEPAKIEAMLAQYNAKREIEALEDLHPDWRTIVGQVDVSKEQPDPNHPFRKWLGTKDAAYQERIAGTESAAVLSRAIRLFQNETKTAAPQAAAKPRDDARAERIRSAVQPRGDNAGGPAAKNDDDEFMAGFNSR